ncbi:hypothetical protein A2U01_0068962, partial [Trifolium medium]|nr:hypothetical protein [Trifolium medium]
MATTGVVISLADFREKKGF